MEQCTTITADEKLCLPWEFERSEFTILVRVNLQVDNTRNNVQIKGSDLNQ
jgi:hypothetical protein